MILIIGILIKEKKFNHLIKQNKILGKMRYKNPIGESFFLSLRIE